MSKGTFERDELERLSFRVLKYVNEAVSIITPDIRLAWVNPEFCRLTGYDRDEVIGQPLTILRSGMHDETEYEGMREAVFGQGRWHGEVWRKKKDGTVFPAWLTISAIYDENGDPECFVDLFVDIERIRKERERLEFLVNHDALTGLPNRRLFWDRLENAIRRSERHQRSFGLLFMDLDNFKQVNDNKGHRIGDEVLVEVARTLQSSLRNCDTIARVGGDEFAVIFEEIDLVGPAQQMINRVQAALDTIPVTAAEGICTGASMGLAVYPRDGTDAATLYDVADVRMYADKNARK